jgi:hypothetical protein
MAFPTTNKLQAESIVTPREFNDEQYFAKSGADWRSA